MGGFWHVRILSTKKDDYPKHLQGRPLAGQLLHSSMRKWYETNLTQHFLQEITLGITPLVLCYPMSNWVHTRITCVALLANCRIPVSVRYPTATIALMPKAKHLGSSMFLWNKWWFTLEQCWFTLQKFSLVHALCLLLTLFLLETQT